MMRKTILVISIFCILGINIKAQTDTEFWFAAPDISTNHGNNGRPLYLHMSAVRATTVTIERPSDLSFTPITQVLAAGQAFSLQLDDNTLFTNVPDDIEVKANANPALGVESKGFKITSTPGEITCFYELNSNWNRDIFPLKGLNALGNKFTVTTQNIYNNSLNYPDARSGFIILATEANTTVSVDLPVGINYVGFPGGGSQEITLPNAGDAFTFRVDNRFAATHPVGVLVECKDPSQQIAVTVWDDSMERTINGTLGSGGCLDTYGDQLVPDELLGENYIIMRGQLGIKGTDSNWRLEYIFITAIEDNTEVYVDGALQTTIHTGEVFSYNIANRYTKIYTSNPSSVTQITGSGQGCEQGGAILPTTDGCTGSHDVTFAHGKPASDNYHLNIMVRNDTTEPGKAKEAINNFFLNVEGTITPIPPSYFEFPFAPADSSWACLIDDFRTTQTVYNWVNTNIPYTNDTDDPQVATISNDSARFHLAVLQGESSNGAKYGYFSDYASSSYSAGVNGAFASQQELYCNLDPFQVVAVGGETYNWTCEDANTREDLTHMISDVTLADPYFDPDTAGLYLFEVDMTGECYDDTTMVLEVRVIIGPTSNFTLSEVEGCSPFKPLITNTTDAQYVDSQEWIFDPPNDVEIINDESFYRTFTNTSDTTTEYTISLLTNGIKKSCANILTRTIKVKPEVYAELDIDTAVGCHPLIVNFDNLSTGHLDSTSYRWDFGDYSQSSDSLPSHSYSNYTNVPDTFDVVLTVTSPLNCTDTDDTTIVVYPRVQAQFSLDTNNGCSPFTFNMNPAGSYGLDTLVWVINDGDTNNIFRDNILRSYSYEHRDTTYADGPDTLEVMLIGRNDYGCESNSVIREVVVYPEIISVLDVDESIVCDSIPVTFFNYSLGDLDSLRYEWDFGDGTYKQDSSQASQEKTYLNRTNSTISFVTTLKTISQYQCVSYDDTTVYVHPYLNASFGLEFDDNCSPLDVTFTNTSTRVHDYTWDLGDGTTVDYDTTQFAHRYINDDIYSDTIFYIELIAENNEGCTDTTSRSVKVLQPVIANFNLPDTINCSPFDVTIENTSTGDAPTYSWTFGDNTFNTNSNLSFIKTFNNFSAYDTSYFVRLTASTSAGCDSSISKDIYVYSYIDADFTLPVVDSCSPLTLRLTNLSSEGANITKWDFGNGETSTDRNPLSPTYENIPSDPSGSDGPQYYDVNLIAYGQDDTEHEKCADTNTVRITIYPELEASFLVANTMGCQPLVSSVSNASLPSSDSATSFTWKLDGDFYSLAEDPSDLNIPNKTDNDVIHQLALYGTTKYGCRDTAYQDLTVHSLVSAYFTTDRPNICSGDSVFIDRSQSAGGIETYNWYFNNNTSVTDSSETFYHSYENSGNSDDSKYITLTVINDAGCDSSWTRYVNVYPEVIADFEADDSVVCYPHNTTFDNLSKNATSYDWSLGDGTNSSLEEPSNRYINLSTTVNDTHIVKLIAKSEALCVDSISKTMVILAKPKADFDFSSPVECPPFNAEMTNNSSVNPDQPFYEWDFAGDSTSYEVDASYTFYNDTEGTLDKPITLYVTSIDGCKDTLMKILSVYADPKVEITASLYNGCSPLYVDFTSLFSNAVYFDWTIDDNITFSSIEDANYRFENELEVNKTHEIKLKITDGNKECTDSASTTITIFPSPVADFVGEPIPEDYNTELDYTTITFYNETNFQDNWDYDWSYGDGNTNEDTQAIIDYKYGYMVWGDITNSNQIPVQLIAYNKDNPECNDTVNHAIIITPPLPLVDIDEDVEGCSPYTVNFGSTTKYNYDDDYLWEFGLTGETSTDPTPSYTYSDPGVYTVKLTVNGDGGTNWDYKLIGVNPKPEAEFTFSDSVVYDSSQTKGYDWIDFYNQSTSGSIYRWYFDSEDMFEDGYYTDTSLVDSYIKDPRWAYPDLGTYYITLLVESNKGCLDTLKKYDSPITVIGEGLIQYPTAFFVNPETTPPSEYDTDFRKGNLYLFYPVNVGVTEYTLEIYNRWGAVMFETDDINKGWNGYYDGIPVKQDVYVWRAKGKYSNGLDFSLSGDVMVIRGEVNNSVDY